MNHIRDIEEHEKLKHYLEDLQTEGGKNYLRSVHNQKSTLARSKRSWNLDANETEQLCQLIFCSRDSTK